MVYMCQSSPQLLALWAGCVLPSSSSSRLGDGRAASASACGGWVDGSRSSSSTSWFGWSDWFRSSEVMDLSSSATGCESDPPEGGGGGGSFLDSNLICMNETKEDQVLTCVLLLLAGELLLQGALPAELHAPQLLLRQRGGWRGWGGWGGLDQSWQVV